MDVREDGRLIMRIEEYEMGKKYEAYEKAAQAENKSIARLMDAELSGDKKAVEQARADLQNNNKIANVTWKEFKEDPKG